MEQITELTKIDYSVTFISIFVILIGLKAIISLVEWFCTKFGLETKWMRGKREERELLMKTVQGLSDLQKKHDRDNNECVRHDEEIKADLKILTDMFLDKEIEDIRWSILDFTSSLSSGKNYNKETFNHVFKMYDKYEKILRENHMENGLIEESMKFIREMYGEKLKEEI